MSVEADPDRKVEMMASSALVLAAGLQELPLASLRTLTDTINDCQGGFISQRLDTALQQLAPALVPCLMRKLAPQLSTERLDVMLKVLQRTLQAEPTMGAVLKNWNNMSPVQAAVQRHGSMFTAQLWEQVQNMADQGANAPLRSVVHARAREQVRTANALDLPDPFEVDILPTFEELLRTDGRLPTNRDGSWDADSEEQLYRQTHFLLYKEELLAPLREAVASFLSQKAGHGLTERLTSLLSRLVSSTKSAKPVNSTFYPNTRAVDFAVSSNKKPMLQLQFETGGRRIDFSLGSHLIHGSLVILFETNSQQAPLPDSAMYAVVEEFDLRQATHRNVVGVSFLDPDDLGRFSISKKYVMVESPAYFHAIRPVLEWLQNPDRLHNMQLKHDLLSGVRRERVEFLRGVQVDISCLYKRELSPKESWKSRDPLQPWPDPQDIELDPSQQEAMKHILRSSVPLVQGPPGTGKSYIGVKAVQILRQALDKKGYKEPIVLVCLTNHALDQFLEDLLDLFPGRLIRFGGRTKSEDARLLGCMVHHHMRGSKDDFIDRKTQEEKLELKVQSLQSVLRSVATLKGQVRLLITGLSIDGLVQLLESIGTEELEYGMFYQPDPARRASPARNFILWVLHSWAEGWSLQDTQAEVQVPKYRTSAQEVEIHNRFAVLGEDQQTADWARPLDDVDRLIGRTPAMLPGWNKYTVVLEYSVS
ncbi:ZNFX1 [Symbiodinium necroappetens]|uniref:ZNFX1 protein n=1 Tax=Symbiodinium necroappetens TaxID=1628268 RepID=A0A813AW36_9DINO|nr:ZNFX1 [Symbiodinium necroappetens]